MHAHYRRPVTLLVVFLLCLSLIPAFTISHGAAQEAPWISLEPASGEPGDRVEITGGGFPSEARGDIVWAATGEELDGFRTRSDGTIEDGFPIPDAAAGEYIVAAVVGETVAESVFLVEDDEPPTETPLPTATDVPTDIPTSIPTDAPTETPAEPTPDGRPRDENPAFDLSFAPDADSRVDADRPDENFGTEPRLIVDTQPEVESYLRFTVEGAGASVASATLRLYVKNDTDDGPRVYPAGSEWSEETATWNTRPSLTGAALDDRGEISGEEAWVTFDVSALVTGDGTYTFALLADADDRFETASREDADAAPQLLITLAGAPPSTLTPTSIPTQTSTEPPTNTATATLEPSTLTLAPVADARVLANDPDTNFGASDVLRSDKEPASESYLQFTVPPFDGTIQKATLRLWVLLPTVNGPSVYLVGNDWTENGITWNNRPDRIGNLLDDLDAMERGAVAYDVTVAISGPGTYSFVLDPTSRDGVEFASREAAEHGPQLELSIGGTTVPPTSVATETAAPTETAISSPTSTVTAVPSETSSPTATSEPPVDTATATATVTETPTESATSTATVTETPVNTATSSPTATNTSTATTTATSVSGGGAVLVGAGDIASSGGGDEITAQLLDGIPGTVITLGDNVYPDGTASEFTTYYAPTWGRHLDRTRPAAGNHDYQTAGASGYFGYFGAVAGAVGEGWYSYDLGGWHVIVLNSNCAEIGGCGEGSPQELWLRADLAANPTDCTVAYWHHPRFSSGTTHGSDPALQPLWQALYDSGAEIVLAGHEHNYERFGPLDPAGNPDAGFGIRSFVVGTGGIGHYDFGSPITGSEVRNSDTFGVIELTLRAGGYDWEFVPEPGATFTDSGSGSCHGAPQGEIPTATATSAPTQTATVAAPTATQTVAPPTATATPTQTASAGPTVVPGGPVTALVETDPVPHSGDAADDPAIWVDPSNPARSTVIGTDKLGGLAVYDLTGNQLFFYADSSPNNVDLRGGFTLGGQQQTIVATSDTVTDAIRLYTVDPATRGLTHVSARTISTGIGVAGLCMYVSPTSGTYYVFIGDNSGTVQQWELFTSGNQIDARQVRTLSHNSVTEGCVADDVSGALYVSQEDVAIWRYGAEPTAGSARSEVDSIGPNLTADIEGLAIYDTGGGSGYLIASSQGNDTFAVYDRNSNAFIGTFDITAGPIDAVTHSDGIEVTSVNLGGVLSAGLFVAQDDSNSGGQNFKLVPWITIAGALGLD